MRLAIAANLVAFLCLTAITGIVSYLMRLLGLENVEALQLWAVGATASLFLVLLFRDQIVAGSLKVVLEIILSRQKGILGIKRLHSNFASASERVLNKFREAENVRIFIQLGRGVIGGSNSLLFESAKRRHNFRGAMEILFAADDAGHLCRERAEERGSVYSEWTSAISYTKGSLVALEEAGVRVSSRCHSEPYLWRLFFFDQLLFVVPYIFDRNNSELAPVIEIAKAEGAGGSLYSTFERYYKRVWDNAD